MAPSTRCDPTKVLNHVCDLMKLKPSPKYIPISKGGGFLSYLKIKNLQYPGKIGGSLAEAHATAASNALENILKENKYLKKDEIVQEYLALLEDPVVKDHQVREPSVRRTKYVEALISLRDVKVDILVKAMEKLKNSADREKFSSMGVEDRYKWLKSLARVKDIERVIVSLIFE